jgi:hypothetical protein
VTAAGALDGIQFEIEQPATPTPNDAMATTLLTSLPMTIPFSPADHPPSRAGPYEAGASSATGATTGEKQKKSPAQFYGTENHI